MTMLNFPQQARIVAGKPLGFGVESEAAAGLGLKTNLVAWWELDEASGNRADSHTNALTLTDNNTVGSAAGIGGSGTAASFVAANSEYLSSADKTKLSLADNQSISVVIWVYLDSLVQQGFIAYGLTNDILRFQTYLIGFNDAGNGYNVGASRFFFSLANNASTSYKNVVANTFGAPSSGTWYMLAGTFNAATDEVKISVNAGAQDTTTGVTSTGFEEANNSFAIGRPGSANVRYMNGRAAKAGLWKDRVLTTAELTALYAIGAGVVYADL